MTVYVDEAKHRVCAWCGVDISGHHVNAKHCGQVCRERAKGFHRAVRQGQWPKELYGPRPPVTCPVCGAVCEKRHPRQLYCERGGPCSQSAFYRTETSRAYRSRLEVKERQREAARRHAETPHGRAAQKDRDARPLNLKRRLDWSRSEHGKQVKAECQRRDKSNRALSLLLLPIRGHVDG